MINNQSADDIACGLQEETVTPERMLDLVDIPREDSEGSEVGMSERRSEKLRSNAMSEGDSQPQVVMQKHHNSVSSVPDMNSFQAEFPPADRMSVSINCPIARRSRSRSRSSLSNLLNTDRLTQLVQQYPLMQVAGTAFENQIRRSDTFDSSNFSSRSASAAEPLSPSVSSEKVDSNISGQLNQKRPHESIVPLAARLKRGIMWQLLVVHALTSEAWMQCFRYKRLQEILKTHLLPVILLRRSESKESGRQWYKHRRQDMVPTMVGDEEGVRPQGPMLAQRCSMIASFDNQWLCETLAAAVLRYRYRPGDAIVLAGTPSQDMLYILISGKCDAIRREENVEGRLLVHRRRLSIDESFGGFLGGRDTFTETFRAVSQCVVWSLTREDFERAFDGCVNEQMRERYLQMLEEHYMKRLINTYPIKDNMHRVPFYRRISRPYEEYIADFTPVVMTNGRVLFNQGDSAGAVYCLVEGEVCRDQLGPDMTYDPRTHQILSPNDASNSFGLNTRFVLFGEESHILPHRLRYRCTVASRVALFYRIEGERFVSALLDNAKLLLEMREILTNQIRMSMYLAPEALLNVPVLCMLPKHSLNAITNAAQPRVVERGLSICEPARTITEIYLITAGNIRDPRELNHQPTLPVSPPQIEEEEQQEEITLPRGKTLKERTGLCFNTSRQALGTGGSGGTLGTAGSGGSGETRGTQRINNLKTTPNVGRKVNSGPAGGIGVHVGPLLTGSVDLKSGSLDSAGKYTPRWGFFNSTVGTLGVVYPDEQIEFSPLCVPNPARAIVCTAGGGWEGLLIDKWPNGWETVTTVELWALPMLKIRTEFGSMPKTMQNTVLTYVRGLQMRDLNLAAPIVAKLPPMSTYQPPEKRQAQPTLLPPDVSHRSSSHEPIQRGRRSVPRSSQSLNIFSTPNDGELSISYSAGISSSSTDMPADQLARHSMRYRQQHKQKRRRAPKGVKQQQSPQKESVQYVGNTAKTNLNPDKSLCDDEDFAAPPENPEVPKRKAGPPQLLCLRRLASKHLEEQPVITPELCAIYAGKQDPAETGIIYYPPQVKKLLPPAQQPVAWPVLVAPHKQWFGVVPKFEPLPGTVNNLISCGELPCLVPNTAMLAKQHPQYGSQLMSHAAYFESVARSRQLNEQPKGELVPKTLGSTVSPTKAPAVVGQPAPGRYTYTL